MIKIVCYAAPLGMIALLAACGQSAPAGPASTRVMEARQFLHDEVVHGLGSPIKFRVFSHGESYVKNVDITPTRIKIVTENSLDPEGKMFVFSLKELTPNSICDEATCLVSIIRDGSLMQGHYISYEFSFPNVKNASRKTEQLTYALSTLQKAALTFRSTDGNFQKVVADYNDATPKPTLPDGAQRLKAQAEQAVHNGQLNDAVDYYEQALEMAPWWSEGHFNLAINLANSKDYKGATDYAAAVDEMKCYLMLAPEGSDAPAAQDKIKEWEGKMPQSKWYEF